VTDEDESLVRSKMKSSKMEFPVALAATDVNEKFPIKGFPTTYIVNRDGDVAWKGHPAQLTTEMIASLFE
jgi:predicted metal-binding protein